MNTNQHYDDCIAACVACIVACNRCLDACLGEKDVQMMASCMRHDRDCALICSTAVTLMASNSPFAAEYCKMCAKVCEACAAECGKHEHDHCKHCAEVCKKCAEACGSMKAAA